MSVCLGWFVALLRGPGRARTDASRNSGRNLNIPSPQSQKKHLNGPVYYGPGCASKDYTSCVSDSKETLLRLAETLERVDDTESVLGFK